MTSSLNFVRSSLFAAGYFVFTTCYGLLSLFLRVVPAKQAHAIIISWTYVILWWARICCGIRWRIVGLEKLQDIKNQPVVVLSKHQCAWETFFLQGLFWPAATVLKKELLKIPFFGWGLAALRPIAIDRSNPRLALKQVKEEGQQRLKSGINLILFPEGTRVAIGQKAKYARSGADIAREAGVKVIPICHDAGRYWGDNKQFVKKPGCVTVVIGNAIDSSTLDSKSITQEVESWIEATLEKIIKKEI
ncbi:lysophospholipid acyltransferase family protein [Agaribacterium haliotis]|uniref:lysophospholipid acyltransferase family protein n=1 Tax=Agaribacterium haliotis TaxID=2013869 RepID=UPI001EFC6E4F|nr:lysophospholipid acyltransferase family protein [Agaribacterium haliotis]